MPTLSTVRRIVCFVRTISKKNCFAHCWHLSVLDGPLFGPWWSTPCCTSPGVAQEPHSRTAVSLDAGEDNVPDLQTSVFGGSSVMWMVSFLLFWCHSELSASSVLGHRGLCSSCLCQCPHLKKNQQIAKRAQEGQAFYLRQQKQSALRHIRCIAAVLLVNASMSVGQHWLSGLVNFDLICTASYLRLSYLTTRKVIGLLIMSTLCLA